MPETIFVDIRYGDTMKKLFAAILLFLFCMVTMAGCPAPHIEAYHPCAHPNSTWVAEKEGISFTIGEDVDPVRGVMIVDGDEIDVEFDMGILCSTIGVFASSDTEEIPEYIEIWGTRSVKKDVFTIYVKESTYFQKGQEITFRRVD